MKRVSMFLLVLALFLTGCNNSSDFESAIKDEKEAILEEQDKYDEQLSEAEELINNEEYDVAKELLHTIISETEGAEHLKEQYEKATEMLSELGEDDTTTSSNNTLSDKVFIDYATEDFLGKFDSYNEFTDGNNERIVFWSEKSISNFKFIEIGYEVEGSDFSYFQSGVLYSIDTLSPEKPVVINTIISEGIPNRGISYMDGSGNERYFYITWSGFDDSLSLTEFENKEPSGSSSNSNTTDLSEERSDKVLDATLQILSTDGYTTVDFTKRTAFRDGKEMIFEIVSIPDEGHTEFQEGLIREKIDEIQSHTLYAFEFDDNNKLTLIEPATLEAVYTE